MKMKQLFRHTSSLLRSVLLLGAMAFVNIQQAQAQTAEQLAAMPNAFETKTPTIGDGQYYYIQYYYGGKISYLTDCGVGNKALTTDFLPSNNRLWTLVAVGGNDTHFKLKSKDGNFLGFGVSNRYGSVASYDDGVTFTLQPNEDGYNIFDVYNNYDDTHANCFLGRYQNNEWGDLPKIRVENSGRQNSRMHFVQLKSNVAYIIYYRGEHADGADNTSANASTTRHYLTYSGVDSEITTSVIFNGDLEGALGGGDASCFYIGDPSSTTARQATITNGIGVNNTKGISITSSCNTSDPQEWDTQLFIRAKDVIPVGKSVHVKFDYRASAAVNGVATQAHAEPGNYRAHGSFGSLNFTTEWQTFETTVTVSDAMGNDFQTVALNLYKNNSGVIYYFDNIVFEAPISPAVSSRRSIIPPDKSLYSLPTLAAYHQDGLWTLEGTGTDGEFYIKKYGDEQYLTVRQIDTYNYCTILGNKDNVYGIFNLETPTANRYTRIHNNCPMWGNPRYLTYSNGDGSPVIQAPFTRDDYFYAAFYPVEVPVPNKDEFYQVLVKWSVSGEDRMINHNGGYTTPFPTDPAQYHLWQLEMIDDYEHFRLKAPDGRYLKPSGSGMTPANDPTDAEIMTNEKFWTDFSLTWFYVNPVPKEIPRLNNYVTHRESYLKQYAERYSALSLGKQGLATEAESDWWNFDGNGFDTPQKGTQKVNHFEITHYVKQGNSMLVEFPTVLTRSNDHVYFQRFYNYEEKDTEMNLDNLKAHVSLDTRDDGNVQYFLYKNGMVTGRKLDWSGYDEGGYARNEQRRFNFTNSDGEAFTVAVDVSRYSDLTYKDNGDLEEPSLTMRYLYYMKDAKEVAASLTACPEGGSNWLEFKEFHFPAKQIAYESQKKAGYRGEFIGLRHIFSDYWVFDDDRYIDEYNDGIAYNKEHPDAPIDLSYLNDHLVSAVNNNNGGKIEVELGTTNNPGIRLGGYNPNIDLFGFADGNDGDYRGFYFYDKMGGKTSYGDSRFVVFRYPANGEAGATGASNPAYINVYLNNDGKRYQLAQFKIVFDPDTETKPWKDVTIPVAINGIQGTDRDPNNLRAKAGHPIAKITFDYPDGDTYHYPASTSTGPGTRQDGGDDKYGTIANSSPVPLTFGKTNYSFDGDNTNWGSYAMVGGKSTVFGKFQRAEPVNDATYGYNIDPDPGFKSAFLYIDASEQPGDICSAPFVGDFCSGDKLMFSGWISGSNYAGESDNRCPGGVTLTVKGEHMVNGKLTTETLYRFCPGQCYELDDNTEAINGVSFGVAESDRNRHHVVWQQFYFEFTITEKYDRHWIEVNNNCVSSNGGDFMLDNIEVYAIVPEVIPGINTPLCVSGVDEHGNPLTDMRLLKLSLDFNKLKSSSGLNSGTGEEGFVFLDKYKFLTKFRSGLAALTSTEKTALHLDAFDFTTITLDELADAIEDGQLNSITGANSAYQAAFDEAVLGEKTTWYSKNPSVNMNSSIMYFEWNSDFESMPEYSFASAVNKKSPVYREVVNGEKFVVMNGNFPELKWKTNTDYYVINTNVPINSHNTGEQFTIFNLCSECTKASVFRIEPPYHVLGLESSETTGDYVVCEGQIPTILLDLRGYTLDGKEVDMNDLNFDWWLGNKNATDPADRLATLENYHKQTNGSGVKLDEALSTLRTYYPAVTSLDGITKEIEHHPDPKLTVAMIEYLQSLIDKGELILHQKSVNISAEKASNEDPYFYLVACPIHDEKFDQALNPAANQYVSYFCDEPQGLRIKVGQKAPRLKCGFVPGENGFDSYSYPTDSDPVLSIRLAKAEQFEKVRNAAAPEATNGDISPRTDDLHYLWLPIRNAQTQTATGVVKKAQDDNIYLASTNDPEWDKKIYKSMSQAVPSLPVVGRIVQLTAINTGNDPTSVVQTSNRLCVYFTQNFEVREGYNYTLSMPFQEEGDVNTCDGTILINLKIVPDYEVWTGGADNSDWNNDDNWRRADGNTTNSSGVNGDELYVKAAEAGSPLENYTTNAANYRTPKDRIFRKGFAPLYCTHILMKSDEWGNTPKLYDAIDGHDAHNVVVNGQTISTRLDNSPFPNLRDKDGWDGTVTDEVAGTTATKATATSILRFDMQARLHDIWKETYGSAADRGVDGDLLAEMYQVNSCDEIVFQPGTELLNAQLLNYNSAWVEYELDTKRWYLLGSPLQGTIAGEWYAPTGNAPQQKTTYYDPVIFGDGYDRYSPAIYQRSWDKAKAVLYEVGSVYSTSDNTNDLEVNNDGTLPGSVQQGAWALSGQDITWNVAGADSYLDRLGYKPLSGNKANVAIQGIWSNTYNDATVDYSKGGFSVMVMNHLKGNSADAKAIVRLPKEDPMYDYYKFEETGSADGGTVTDLEVVRSDLSRNLNRGRLKTDLLLPAILSTSTTIQKEEKNTIQSIRYVDRYGDRIITRIPIKEADLEVMTVGTFTETVSAGVSNLGYYLVENPFACGLDMDEFFAANKKLHKKYWLLTKTGQHLVQWAETAGEWINHDGTSDAMFTAANRVLAPGQGFFVQYNPDYSHDPADPASPPTEIVFNKAMQAQSRFGKKTGESTYRIEVGQTQRMKELTEKVDTDNDGTPDTEQTVYIDVDLDGNGIYGETITIDGQTVVEREAVMVPVYTETVQDDPDNPGQTITIKTPVLDPVMEDVTVSRYVQSTVEGEVFPLKARTRGEEVEGTVLPGLVITAERGESQSSALVMQHDKASNDFLPSEDTETFITSDLENVPTVYTLCGRLATTINSIHDFRSLPIGVESSSDAPCTLTFKGVELLGDSISFYDAVEQKLTPLTSGMHFAVSGQTQNRYYLVRSLSKQDAAEETHLQIFTEGLTAKVIASTAEPITNVRCYDTAGRLVHSATPQTSEYSFTLPIAGIYIIDAQTDNDRKTKKLIAK